MATANHWWLDGVGGIIAVLLGLLMVSRLAGPAAACRGGGPPGAVRIAMVTEYAYPVLGGVPEHVHNLSRELVAPRARGHRADQPRRPSA